MKLIVDGGGYGDTRTIGEALARVPDDESSVLWIRPGVYREKLYCDKADITLIGESPETTVLSWGDGAYRQHADGRPFGTFRSYTAFFGGGRVQVENLSIENTAGDGRIAGQAIAAYVDARNAYFRDVRLLGRQDTLFAAPLPESPRIPGSFIGPRENASRKPSLQYYLDCRIEGDVDFIFGGAQAMFERCKLVSRNRGEPINGYIAAPCTPKHQKFGFLFYQCCLTSNCPPGSVFLGRPWRAYANAAFLECELGAHIDPAGWDNWSSSTNEQTARFSEYQNTGPGAAPERRVGWCRMLDAGQRNLYDEQIARCRALCPEWMKEN